MSTHRETSAGPGTGRLVGRVLTTIAVLFMLFDGLIKLIPFDQVRESWLQLGYPPEVGPGIGWVELVCLALYVAPRTSVLGGILLTGYLGGAIATHVRVGNPLFSHVLFPIYVALPVWGGIFLREARLRALVPFRGAR